MPAPSRRFDYADVDPVSHRLFLAQLGASPPASWLHHLLEQSHCRVEEFSPQELTNTVWGFAKLGYQPTDRVLLQFFAATQVCPDVSPISQSVSESSPVRLAASQSVSRVSHVVPRAWAEHSNEPASNSSYVSQSASNPSLCQSVSQQPITMPVS